MSLGLAPDLSLSSRRGAGVAPPPVFAPNAVILNPRMSLDLSGLSDSATVLVNLWVNLGIGSPAHFGNAEAGGNTAFNSRQFSNVDPAGIGSDAEISPGMNMLFDNSPGMPLRWNINDSSITPGNQGSHSSIEVEFLNPQDGNDIWACFTLYADISVITGTVAAGAIWRTLMGQAPVKVVNGLQIANANPTWTNGGPQKINLANALGFLMNTAFAGRMMIADYWLATPPAGFIDGSNNLVAGLSKFVTPGGMPVDQTAGGAHPTGNASGITPVRFLSGNRTIFLTDRSGASTPAIVGSTFRSHLYNAPLGPGAEPDRPYLVWTHAGPMPTTLVHTYTGMQFYGSEIRKDDGLLITVQLENNTSTTGDHHPTVVAASGATYAAVEVTNSRQMLTGGREMQTVQYLIRMDTRDITAPGADYGLAPTINWLDLADGDTLFGTCWQASIIRNLDWVNGPIDVSAGTTEAGGAPGVGTGFLRCPSVIPTTGKRLMVNTFCPYQTSDGALSDAGPPTNPGQELWWEAMTISGGGPMITYELVTGDGSTATGNRDAQYSGTTVRNNIGITTVFR